MSYSPIPLFEKRIDEDILHVMQAGTHLENPYHNNDHMMHVAFHACMAYEREASEFDRAEYDSLTLAALFHDFDHSGGKATDAVNIARTCHFIGSSSAFKRLCKIGIDPLRVMQLIQCTQYDGPLTGFRVEPTSLTEKCLRDADLMMIYTVSGREVLLGLFEEIHNKPIGSATMSEKEAFVKKNAEFLRNARFYTTYGQRMQQDQLERCLKLFELRVFDGVWERLNLNSTESHSEE